MNTTWQDRFKPAVTGHKDRQMYCGLTACKVYFAGWVSFSDRKDVVLVVSSMRELSQS